MYLYMYVNTIKLAVNTLVSFSTVTNNNGEGIFVVLQMIGRIDERIYIFKISTTY